MMLTDLFLISFLWGFYDLKLLTFFEILNKNVHEELMVHVVLILFFLSQFPAFKKLDSGSKYGLNKYVSDYLNASYLQHWSQWSVVELGSVS